MRQNMMILLRITLILLVVGIMLLGVISPPAPTTYAQDGGESKLPTIAAQNIADTMDCYTCSPSGVVALSRCTSAQCVVWHSEIQFLLDRGNTPSYIYGYFATNYSRDFPTLSSDNLTRITDNIICQDCGGQPISRCETEQCQLWRGEIRDWLTEGRTFSAIYRELAAQYSADFPNLLKTGQHGDTYPPTVNLDAVDRIAGNMSCADCAGETLRTCTSEQCKTWRQEIGDLLADGLTPSAVYRTFAAKYPTDFSTLLVTGQLGDTFPPTIAPNDVYDIAEYMPCAECGEEPLRTCPTNQCQNWRQEIGDLLYDGLVPSLIYREFATVYPADFPNLLVVGQFGDYYPPNVDPNDVYYIAEKMYCDVCAGVSLSYCTSGQCQNWREEISDLLADGYSETEVRQQMSTRYGEKISAVPIDPENRFLTFALPIGLALIAALGVFYQVYRLQNKDNRALQAARLSGTQMSNNRPIPDNVDPILLQRVLMMLEEDKS